MVVAGAALLALGSNASTLLSTQHPPAADCRIGALRLHGATVSPCYAAPLALALAFQKMSFSSVFGSRAESQARAVVRFFPRLKGVPWWWRVEPALSSRLCLGADLRT
eukprot:scaffold13280_cov114-Isochrysis_galbana.AAC.1